MSKTIGYFEGTDSTWLTELQLLGHHTLPLSNGVDGHGLDVQHLNPQNHVDAVIGYLHKLVPSPGQELTPLELLHATRIYEIAVFIACPRGSHDIARRRLGELPPNAQLVDPADMLKAVAAKLR